LVGVLVPVAATVHVLGELWLSSAMFAVVFDLAPHWAQGQYQGASLLKRANVPQILGALPKLINPSHQGAPWHVYPASWRLLAW
jgi:hypothetical protein